LNKFDSRCVYLKADKMDHTYPVLRHALDKVRYFRNVLYGDDMRVRIVVGHGATGKTNSLHNAVDDIELGSSSANQICLLNCEDSVPRILVRDPKDRRTAILIYFRWVLDDFVEALLREYGEANCEIVLFEPDPTF